MPTEIGPFEGNIKSNAPDGYVMVVSGSAYVPISQSGLTGTPGSAVVAGGASWAAPNYFEAPWPTGSMASGRDDDFASGTALQSGFSVFASGTSYDINGSWPSWIHVRCTGSTALAQYFELRASYPSGTADFSCTMKFSWGFSNKYDIASLTAYDSGNLNGVQLLIEWNAQVFLYFGHINNGTPNYWDLSSQVYPGDLAGTFYLHLERRNLAWYGYLSTDGRAWTLCGNATITQACTLDHLFFELSNQNTLVHGNEGGIDWIRINDFYVGGYAGT